MLKPTVATGADPNVLATWEKDAEEEIASLTSSMIPLQAQLEAARERLDLIRRLARLSNGSSRKEPSNGQSVMVPGNDVEDHIEQLLHAAGEPMHIGVIRERLIEQGVPLPGRGDEANIILRLRRDSARFVRTGRGTYGLASWNLVEVPPTAKKRRLRRQRRSLA
jgi:hypothetical protein